MVYTKFDGNYFVSYIDISGFTKIIKEGVTQAKNALEIFFDSVHPKLRTNDTVQCFFVSDCAILFVRDEDTKIEQLNYLLEVIEEMNVNMITNDYLLTSSISYGNFHYQSFDDSSRIQRAVIYGEAYLEAYLDNEAGHPKLLPGLCRIQRKRLPEEVENFLDNKTINYNPGTIQRYIKTDDHYYYYWMLNRGTLNKFEEKYREASQQIYSTYKTLIKEQLNIM